MTLRDLSPLLNPRSIVVVGASTEPARIGGRPLHLAKVMGFSGKVLAVNPKYQEAQGYPCYPSVAELPFVPDLAILALGAKDVLDTLRACALKGIRAAVIFAGGFAELANAEGVERQRQLAEFGRTSGMLIAGPNTLGLVNVPRAMYATFMSAVLDSPMYPGDVALVAQSGGACIAVLNALRKRGIGMNYVLNTGNEASIGLSEYIHYVAADDQTQVVVSYVEGLGDDPHFVQEMCRLRDARTPVVLYKVGETEAGADAAASHTARLAGTFETFKAAASQMGLLLAHDMEQLSELAYTARFASRDVGRRVGIITTSGAFAAILTDKFVGAGLTIPKLSEAVQQQIRPHVPAIATIANPVDITANVVNAPDGFGEALRALLRTEELDLVVLFSTAALIDALASQILDAVPCSRRLLAIMVTGTPVSKPRLEAAGIPLYEDTGRGASALASLAWWAEPTPQTPWEPVAHAAVSTDGAAGEARRAIEAARAAGLRVLDEKISKSLLKSFGIPVAEEAVAATAAEAARAAQAMGFPVVAKILSPDILHKTELGAVKLGLRSAQEVEDAGAQILESVQRHAPDARIEGLLLQRQIEPGAEILLSTTVDPLFGPVLSVASGGVAAELLADIRQWVLPVDEEQAASLLRSLKLFPLLDGYRGQPPRDQQAIVHAMLGIARMAWQLQDQVAEIEVNPLIVGRADEKNDGAIAVDCVIKLR